MNKKQIKNWLGLTKEYENISEQVKLCDEKFFMFLKKSRHLRTAYGRLIKEFPQFNNQLFYKHCLKMYLTYWKI